MSNVPAELKYTKSHEWVAVDGDTATVGITDHAQDLLGDMVFIELPEVGDSLEAGNECAVVESVKAASDVYSPLSGEVVEVNEALADSPETVNTDPYGAGWLFKVRMSDVAQVDGLLDAAAYNGVAEEDAH
ncbi:glycine cleavage system protein GcvH [Sulfuriflexus sp.]|uniref:glycine cleavage system protein GcvH n=1 Tax=Sulfuriflexus sp. TaxID=2015443 RepID=UPI0028CCCDE3|nr:glycine cleavage system protein GcvH [Sulfuriflexus sp.]MDT8403372.1 glycine cleavage system protein GcvH [Sulfuriflexus sp.]